MYKKHHIHFIGIGGIGMSGIAKILKLQGHNISGCDYDLNQSSIIELEKLGCKIYPENNHKNCSDTSIDIVVYTTVIKPNNPELLSAKLRNIPTIHRSVILAELMKSKFSIAVTGAHGKTTTTSLISHILIEAKLDPTVVIGGNLKNISSNSSYGRGKFLVAEADESDKSFLNLFPTLEVITNIDLEHLETYKDIEDIKHNYLLFLDKLPFYGKAFVCADDINIRSIIKETRANIVTYGLENKLADIYAYNIKLHPNYSTFNISISNTDIEVCLNTPGKYNILNALAAISVAIELEIPIDIILQALKNFQGVERRFNLVANYKGAEFFDDYGHHPTEISNALIVAKNRAVNKLITIFQPHKYSRTKGLWQDFLNSFINNPSDHLIITDIFPAGEEPIENISGEYMIESLKKISPEINAKYIPYDSNLTAIKEYLDCTLSTGDLVLLLGAGKINQLINKL